MTDNEQAYFYDPGFLSQQSLNSGNIMEYFSRSQYYDKTSINEILKMQSQFAGIDISSRLGELEGIFYVLEYEAEGIFIIAKKENGSKGTRYVKMYYCIHGHIYCAPSARAISECRLTNAFWYINEALDVYDEQKRYSWIDGFKFTREREKEKEGGSEIKFMTEVLHEFERKGRI
ncbi:mediator of RNA polymerase II transcription subunit 6 [Pancytospora epiphaga]|nr:mediator of RNA polymerase II transcription subunit 6 [Pancytospora epiphaga]